MNEPVRIDLSNLNAVERDGFMLLLETERVLAVHDGEHGDSCLVPAEDADKVAELLDIVRDAPTPTARAEVDPLMAAAPVPLPPGSHAFSHGIVLRMRDRSTLAAVAAAIALGALAWFSARRSR